MGLAESSIKWFSDPFDTIEAAQEATGAAGFFEQYGVFQAPDGKYHHANLRLKAWTREEVNMLYGNILMLTGYRLVSYTDALFGWTAYR